MKLKLESSARRIGLPSVLKLTWRQSRREEQKGVHCGEEAVFGMICMVLQMRGIWQMEFREQHSFKRARWLYLTPHRDTTMSTTRCSPCVWVGSSIHVALVLWVEAKRPQTLRVTIGADADTAADATRHRCQCPSFQWKSFYLCRMLLSSYSVQYMPSPLCISPIIFHF